MKRGFTLIELLLYIGLTSGLLLVISAFTVSLDAARVRYQAIGEVEQQGTVTMELLTQLIRTASSITDPPAGGSSQQLSLNTVNGPNPTVINLQSNRLQLTEGQLSPVPLTSNQVAISQLTFQELNDSIRIQYSLQAINPTGRAASAYGQTFIGTANRRPK